MHHVHLVWPQMPSDWWREDFFFAAWHAHDPIHLTHDEAPAGITPALVADERWGAICNTSEGAALAHASREGVEHGTLFRGYLVDPPLHSWSPTGSVIKYWSGDPYRRHNGVFVAITFGSRGTLHIVTDAFGVAPAYWRRLTSGVVLISSSPRYLRLVGDELDPVAERLFMHREALIGDCSLIRRVHRAEPGSVMRFGATGAPSVRAWYDWSGLPPGTEPITPAALDVAEQAFLTAIDRCARVMPGAVRHVPLSSGDDSRRIIAALHAGGACVQALTVRVLQKEFRDLDGRFATELATRFGFPHRVLEMASPTQYADDDHDVRMLLSGEVSEHAWMAPMIRALPCERSLVFDGLAGDIFGNTGYAIRDLHERDPDDALRHVAALATPETVNGVLRPGRWRSLTSVRELIVRQLDFLPPTTHRADLAFLLIRARRGTGPATQHLLPAGHVVVYPYLDLDHAEATLRFSSLDKIAQTLQARCLQQFWPEYYAIGGSRRIPADIPPGSDASWRALQVARLRRLSSEAPLRATLRASRERLRPKYALAATASRLTGSYSNRLAWWLAPFLNLEIVRSMPRACTITHDGGFANV